MILYISKKLWGIAMSQKRLFRHTLFYFLLLSLVVAAIITFMMRHHFQPYQFTVLEKTDDADGIKTFYYHDFDKDGFSELLEIHNLHEERYFIYIKSFAGGTIDQTNYFEPVRPINMLFHDLNGDGYDEIITLTQDTDSLYLYVHDLITKQALINRQFLVTSEAHLSPTGKFVAFFPACIADAGVYDQNVLIFAIRSSSRLPRSVYAFDLDNRKMIKEFPTRAAFTNLFMYDLTGNGRDEIILSSAAWGNIHFDGDFKDDRSWLFVLNQKLEPVFPPLGFVEYPGEVLCLPIEVHAERYILAIPDYHGHKHITQMMYMIDKNGQFHSRAQNLFKIPADYRSVFISDENPSKIFGWLESNQFIKLDHRLEMLDKIHFPYGRPVFSELKDMTNDDQREMVLLSLQFLTVYNKNLERLAVFPIAEVHHESSFRYTGIKNPPEFGIYLGNQFTRLGFIKNKYTSLFYLLFIGLAAGNFLILASIRKFILFITIYKTIFQRFLFDSPNGIVLTNPYGKIRYANHRIATLLDLPQSPLKGEYLQSVLNQYPQILECFKSAMGEKKPLHQKLNLEHKGVQKEMDLSIYPFGFYANSCSLCLIEFKIPAPLPSGSKLETWSRAVQKMAHDIKTPLSTVNLNLKVLQTRLEHVNLSGDERSELADDIEMMRTELDHIQSMTKNFLKFTNLDKPHLQAFDIGTIIHKAVRKHQPYLNPGQDIQVNIDGEVTAVWADPQQIELVLNILLENALSAMQGKGIIQISVTLAQYLDKDFKEHLEVEVADSGPGIAEQDRSKIFEPYFTTKADGTGMGLAIARKIIEDHGGVIDVYSKADFGAVFVFSLPLLRNEDKHE